MKRLGFVLLALTVVAVAYAAVVEGRPWHRLMDWFGTEKRLPALQSAQLPFRYPAELWREGVEGEVLLRIHITAAGDVDSVEIERSSGSGQLDSLALSGASDLKYHPARQGEQGVAVWAILPVRFERKPSSTEGEETGR